MKHAGKKLHHLTLTGFLGTTGALAALLFSPGSHAVSIALDGSLSLESGSDCEAGAVYRFGTTAQYQGKALDLLLSVTGEQNDKTGTCVATQISFATPHRPSFFGTTLTPGVPWYTDVKLQVVEQGTTTPVTVDRLHFSAFDLDTDADVDTDDFYLSSPSSVTIASSSTVTVSDVTVNGPGGVTYTKKLKGDAAGGCGLDANGDTDPGCQGSAEWIQTSEIYFRIQNDDGSPSAEVREIQISLESGDYGLIAYPQDLDDDDDGILDADEGDGAVDTDGDGVPDSRDLDSDNDGLSDLEESGSNAALLDTDRDGRIDAGFPRGANGYADTLENAPESGIANYALRDTDGDLIYDFRDLDSDNDSRNDVIEAGGSDADDNGQLDNAPTTDADGSMTSAPLADPDSDSDASKDRHDLDRNADGTPDIDEAGMGLLDSNNDGTIDSNVDTDRDGIPDVADGNPTVFGDLPGGTGTDLDNDGIPNTSEGSDSNADFDGDGIPNFLDIDSDNDGILDRIETSADFDGDGAANYLDLDADGDGIFDLEESGLNESEQISLDSNADGQFDPATNVGSNGLANYVETSANSGQPDYDNNQQADTVANTDGDSQPDFLDIDSDNDGIMDVLEAGFSDTDRNGKLDAAQAGQETRSPKDTDADLIADYRDLDSDNDGISDILEGKNKDVDANGTADGFTDANQDGADDRIASAARAIPDSDSDGLHDFRDLDADNDGITDIIEASELDSDQNGRVDNAADSNKNGWVDVLEPSLGGTAPKVPDTDNDGVADFRDLDSDNDALTDLREVNGTDSNGDGRLDAPVDSNNDGWEDSLDPALGGTALSIPDTDNDGTADFRDIDSDNDGLNDIEEVFGLPDADRDGHAEEWKDSDNDGLPDSVDASTSGGTDSDGDDIIDSADAHSAANAGAPDADEDGIINSADVDANGDGYADALTVYLAAAALDRDNNGVPDYRQKAIIHTGLDGYGGGAWNPAMLLALGGLALLRRRKLVAAVAMIAATGAHAGDEDFNRRLYVGGSLMSSQLQPDTNTTGYKVGDDSSSGYSLNLGYDISEHWSVETYYADLGEAGIARSADNSKAGNIDYQHMGVSAIGYFFNARDFGKDDGERRSLARREGLTPYGRIGIGSMDNSSKLPYTRDNDVHVHVGGGVEYGFENGFAARAEVTSYDTDALAMSVGVVKRFGETGGSGAPQERVYTPEPAPVTIQRVTLETPEVAAPVPAPAAVAPAPAAKPAVKRVRVRLPYVFFATNSDKLSHKAKKKLDYVVRLMQRYPRLRLSVSGHTDERADESYNLRLSFRRAASVKRYLTSHGIAAHRLSTSALGEAKPLVNGHGEPDLAKNRRVELHIIKPKRK